MALVAVQLGIKIAWAKNRLNGGSQGKVGKSRNLIYGWDYIFGDTYCLSVQDNIYALINTLDRIEDDLKAEDNEIIVKGSRLR